MKHYFDTRVAKDCGINAAVVFENIKFWIEHNRKTGKNEKDGKHWMYQTQAELSEQFDYLSVKQVRTALAKLEEAGYIIKGNFNRHKYDRTTWYAVTDKANAEAIEDTNVEEDNTPQKAEILEASASVEDSANDNAERGERQNARKRQQEPRRARGNGGRNNYKGKKQMPVWANPVPVWIDATSTQGTAIQDIKEVDKKENLLKKIRKLASDCGAVCTI